MPNYDKCLPYFSKCFIDLLNLQKPLGIIYSDIHYSHISMLHEILQAAVSFIDAAIMPTWQ